VGAQIKKPGERMFTQVTELKVMHNANGEELDAYERLLGDAMKGDGVLFSRQDGVEAAWAIVEPILGGETPLHEYEPGTWGPTAAGTLVRSVGGWHCPPG
jgi:glucose-6-phosphate 1-dehydrogenase